MLSFYCCFIYLKVSLTASRQTSLLKEISWKTSSLRAFICILTAFSHYTWMRLVSSACIYSSMLVGKSFKSFLFILLWYLYMGLLLLEIWSNGIPLLIADIADIFLPESWAVGGAPFPKLIIAWGGRAPLGTVKEPTFGIVWLLKLLLLSFTAFLGVPEGVFLALLFDLDLDLWLVSFFWASAYLTFKWLASLISYSSRSIRLCLFCPILSSVLAICFLISTIFW